MTVVLSVQFLRIYNRHTFSYFVRKDHVVGGQEVNTRVIFFLLIFRNPPPNRKKLILSLTQFLTINKLYLNVKLCVQKVYGAALTSQSPTSAA